MLQIKNISKRYVTGELVQTALDNVSLNFRDNEFVAILGPSGSGKTTMLNIIGGLDRYDKGDLIINGISTRKYKDKDWDSYRNHTIGFVFQSYNLIPHQSVLSNVELALTISGISKSERRKKAKAALEKVGLGDQLHKRPNQMSGGQMQRVAIARALVNDPDILLADEPTGALDSETSVQVMELLKEVAKDKLVIMVTHNPELAEEYANRIVRVKDGKIIGDSNPCNVTKEETPAVHKNMGKSSMSFLTSLSLSFNNLRTKKGRTILTSFAGSIGIIGIALILSLSTGVNMYIDNIQKSTMASYPIQIQAQSFDLSSMMEAGQNAHNAAENVDHDMDNVYSNTTSLEMAANVSTAISENNLTAFKKYLDDPESKIHEYIGENGISYSYDTKFSVFSYDPDGVLVNTNGSTLRDDENMFSAMDSMAMYSMSSSSSMMMPGMSVNNFSEIMSDSNGNVSKAVEENYDILYGKLPENYDEIVLVLDQNNEISASVLYQLGMLPAAEYKDYMKKLQNGEEIKVEAKKWSYEEICKKEFTLIPDCDLYLKNSKGYYTMTEDNNEIEKLIGNGLKLKITGIIRPMADSDVSLVNSAFAYTKALTNYLIDYTKNSEVVSAQEADKEKSVVNGLRFEAKNDSEKIEDAKTYVSNMGVSDKAMFYQMIVAPTLDMSAGMGNSSGSEVPDNINIENMTPEQIMAMQEAKNQDSTQPDNSAGNLTELSESDFAEMADRYMEDPDNDVILDFYENYISLSTYEDNMTSFGLVKADTPSAINIYADSFEDKDGIADCIKEYNKSVSEENEITYTDYVALLMSSVTTIINVISYVLIAFVAVSLVVSSIMIGIITYISVLERTKEIGILRAIGASKRNISQVFNAETLIIGFCSGLIGILVTVIIILPSNAIIHSVLSPDVSAYLPVGSAVKLVILSMLLTFIGGLIPSRKAAKKDPVTALRTE